MEKNKTLIITVVTIAVLVIGVISASYAYFAANIANNAVTNVIVKSNTLDTLTYTSGSDLSLTLTQANMAKGSSNVTLSGTAVTPKVTLAGRNDATSTYCYDILVDTTTNNATGQANETMTITCTMTSGNPTPQTCGPLDVTKVASGTNRTILCQTHHIATTSAGATQNNNYSCNVSFINDSGTDQSSLANQIVYQGKIRFQTIGCGGASEPN